MLYPTHYRAGIGFGLLTAIAGASGLFASFGDMPISLTILLAISGGIEGSGFPDIDSPGSIPRQHHRLIGIIFELFHVHHRGKYSHSLLSQSLTWGIMLLLVNTILSTIIHNVSNPFILLVIIFTYLLGNQLMMIISSATKIARSDAVRGYGIPQMMMFIMTDDRAYAKMAHYKELNEKDNLMIRLISYFVVFILLDAMFIESGNNIVKFATPLLSVYIIAMYIGVLSHLAMDVSTKQGIYIGWGNRFSPAKAMMRNPALRWLTPESQFRTGSSWETSIRMIVSCLDIVLFIILIMRLLNR